MKFFSEAHMKKILSWKPNKNMTQIRLYVALRILADTGIRISECLNLTLENIDWDSLLIKVTGKAINNESCLSVLSLGNLAPLRQQTKIFKIPVSIPALHPYELPQHQERV
jgi:integrase